ncbi:MAG: hypothetical protein Q8P93_04405 [bacterium]|nr:hypothetical protein [bacterium]
MKWLYVFVVTAMLSVPSGVLGYTEITKGGVLATEVIPFAPKPGQQVIVRLDTSPGSFDGATVGWRINGVPATSGVAGNELRTFVGALGTVTTIEAVVDRTSDLPIVKTIEINPATAHILVSPDTYTPPGYRGAPEVTPGSSVTLTALPVMRTATGNTVESKDISFTWRNAGGVVAEGRGINTVAIDAPETGVSREVIMMASVNNNEIVAIEKIAISSVSPEVLYYHEHPTLGTMRGSPITTTRFTDEEVTVRAEPFFFSYNDSLDLSWSVDGNNVLPDGNDPYLVTVRRANDQPAEALIDLLIENTTSVLQRARSSFVLLFGSRDFRF